MDNMRRNTSIQSIESGLNFPLDNTITKPLRSKHFGSHLQPMSVQHRPSHQRKLSCEEIINEMEKEQDAVVVRLLRELERLKEENMQLRKHMHQGRPFLSRNNSEKDLNLLDDYESNYHYSLSESSSSPRNSLYVPYQPTPHARRPSPIGINITNSNSMMPIDTSLPTLSLQKKRGSITPTGSSSNILLTENNDSHHWLKSADLDPQQKVPRRWSLSDDNAGRYIEATSETAKRLQEYKLK